MKKLLLFLYLLPSPALADEINMYQNGTNVIVEYVDDNETVYQREIPEENLEDHTDTLGDWIEDIKKRLDKVKNGLYNR
jgi:chaperonin cofactor prefoldin